MWINWKKLLCAFGKVIYVGFSIFCGYSSFLCLHFKRFVTCWQKGIIAVILNDIYSFVLLLEDGRNEIVSERLFCGNCISCKFPYQKNFTKISLKMPQKFIEVWSPLSTRTKNSTFSLSINPNYHKEIWLCHQWKTPKGQKKLH